MVRIGGLWCFVVCSFIVFSLVGGLKDFLGLFDIIVEFFLNFDLFVLVINILKYVVLILYMYIWIFD